MNLFRDMREVLRTLKRRKPSKIYCPRCGSPEIHLSRSLDFTLGPKRYLCDDCSYNGPVVMELEKEE